MNQFKKWLFGCDYGETDTVVPATPADRVEYKGSVRDWLRFQEEIVAADRRRPYLDVDVMQGQIQTLRTFLRADVVLAERIL